MAVVYLQCVEYFHGLTLLCSLVGEYVECLIK